LGVTRQSDVDVVRHLGSQLVIGERRNQADYRSRNLGKDGNPVRVGEWREISESIEAAPNLLK
jgi:hypothetical protein